MNIKVVEIHEDKIDELLTILKDKALWLQKIGNPMWNIKYLEKSIFIERYPNCKFFIVKIMNETIGGFVLVDKENGFWNKNENDEDAFYIHKLVIKEGYTGKGYAKEILKWVEEYARNCGKQYLRLDCFSDIKYLNKLYSKCGFILKRQVEVSKSKANANLYEIVLH